MYIRTKNFKIKIGQTFRDDKRDIAITDRKYIQDKKERNYKYYQYKCNKCGFDCSKHWKAQDKKYKEELWIEESHLLKGMGCSCCGGNQIVVEGINDIPTTASWMIKYFQGGYEEAKKYTRNSGQKIYPICPDCGRIKSKNIKINNIYMCKTINCTCSDKVSYPEKFVFSILEQLGLDFKTQLSKTNFKWCNKYRYDFYFELNNEQYIIETHGKQHYEQTNRKNAKSLKEEQLNDKLKKELALSNGIKEENYIIVDCRESEMKYIKNNILNDNKLNQLFDLNNINWLKAEEFTCSNLVKIACTYKKDNSKITTKDIGKIMGYQHCTIRNWLKKGAKIGWCVYNIKEEVNKNGVRAGKSRRKPVEIFKDGISLGEFESVMELERQSVALFGVILNNSAIARVCREELKQYKGFTFKYINNKLI